MALRVLSSLILLMSLAACSSAQKQRLADREKLSASSGMLCDFVNGDDYQDIEVQLNLEMAKRCDPNKNFSTTDYKNASEVHGIVYCCALKKETKGGSKHDARDSKDDDLIDDAPKAKPAPKIPEKPVEKKEEPKAPAKPEAPKADPKKSTDAKPATTGPSPASVGAPSSAPGAPAASQPAPAQKPPAKAGEKLGEGMESILDD